MKSFLKMLSVACLLGATLIFSGCGDDGGSSAPVDNGGGGVIPGAVVLDGKGTADVPVTEAATGAVTYSDSAATANNVIITGFGADDKIVVTGATSANYDTAISSLPNGDVIINYNNGTATNRITVVGAIPAPVGSTFVSNVAAFNALAVGNLEFQ